MVAETSFGAAANAVHNPAYRLAEEVTPTAAALAMTSNRAKPQPQAPPTLPRLPPKVRLSAELLRTSSQNKESFAAMTGRLQKPVKVDAHKEVVAGTVGRIISLHQPARAPAAAVTNSAKVAETRVPIAAKRPSSLQAGVRSANNNGVVRIEMGDAGTCSI